VSFRVLIKTTHLWWLPVCLMGFMCGDTQVCAQRPIAGQLPSAIGDTFPIQTGTFRSPLLKRDLPFRVFAPDKPDGQPIPTVVYVKNLASRRLGTVPDNELIASFLKEGMLVVEVDYQGDALAKGADMYRDVVYLYRVFGANHGIYPDKPSFSPLMDEFIGWDDERITTYEKFVINRAGQKTEYRINPLWVYVVPEGFTIQRNIEVSTIQTDKRTVTHRMDVIHPASPARPVPAVLEISTTIPAENPAFHTRINRNSCYVFTWTMAGYAGVILDNVANEVTSMSIYGRQMTVPTGPHFPEKRAVRLVRARQNEWGLSGKVAVMGISKSCSRAIMAALVGNERPNGSYFVEADKGPYADQPDRFDAMIAGGFPWPSDKWQAILDYLSDDDPALVWCQSTYLSRMNRPDYVEQVRAKETFLRETIEKRCAAFGLPYRTFFGTPIGHDFDYIYLRYIIAFLDPYMK